MPADTTRRDDALGKLTANLEAAAATLSQVVDRMECAPAARRVVEDIADRVGSMVGHVERIRRGNGGEDDGSPVDWSLDRRWRRTALDMASERPRVLLTIGSNALRSLSDLYDDVLDEDWPSHVEGTLSMHRLQLEAVEAELLETRRRLHP